MPKKLTREEFIKKAKEKHGDKYDYSKVEYINENTKVIMICNNGHIFEQTPYAHLKCKTGYCLYCLDKNNVLKCNKCNKIFPCKYKLERHENSKTSCLEKLNTEICISNSKKNFEDRFKYDNFEYVDCKTKCKFYCNICKEYFETTFQNHLNTKNGGCINCKKNYNKTFDEFKKEMKEKYNNIFDYDENTKKSYKNINSELNIKCNKCNKYFTQSYNLHIKDGFCHYCFKNELEMKHNEKLNTLIYNKDTYTYTHPKFTNYYYCVKTDKIFGKNKELKIKQNNRGNIKLTLVNNNKRLSIYLHRFKYECIYQEIIENNYDIDHIDTNVKNNNIENLQLLTKKEHSRKTYLDNIDRGKKAGLSQGRRGVAINSETNEKIIFLSINDLSKKINSSSANIHRYLRTNKYPPKGFDNIQFEDYNKIENEIWKKYKNIEISNMGRIRDRKRITYGSLDGEKKYYIFSGEKVHNIVAKCFLETKKNINNTIDHINCNSLDNRVINLRWASKSEQCYNQLIHKIKNIQQINAYTYNIINKFENITECKNNLNIYDLDISYRKDWYIIKYKYQLNLYRLKFVNNIIYHKHKKNMVNNNFGITGLTYCKTKNFYEYKLSFSKFYKEYKRYFRIRLLNTENNILEKIKDIAIKNNSAQIIQIYWRSFYNYTKREIFIDSEH